MTIAIGCDHTALDLKREIIEHLKAQGHTVADYGTDSTDACDYPAIAKPLAEAVARGEHALGILICGTGLGMSYAANKVRGIRAACCSEPLSAGLARRHNDANILCFGARIVGPDMARTIVDAFVSSPFEGGRHQRRVDMIMQIEREQERG